MSSFWNLVSFEYKKIFKTKNFILAMAIMIFVSTFCVVGTLIMGGESLYGETVSGMEYEKFSKELMNEISGPFDNTMINTIIKKNNNFEREGGKIGNTNEKLSSYQGYYRDVLPYNSLRANIAKLLSPINNFDFENFTKLTPDDEIDYYGLRTQRIEEIAQINNYSQKEIDKMMQLNSKITTPFYYDYHEGYVMFMAMMGTSMIFLLFAVSICVAPIFSQEYQRKTDALILSSKHGKNKLIKAKLFTVFTFTFAFIIVSLLMGISTSLIFYSSSGANVNFQILNQLSVYPITMAQAVVIFCCVGVFVAMFFSAFISMLSAFMNSFSAIVASLLVLFGGMFLGSIRIIIFLLPAQMVTMGTIFSERLVDFFGIIIEPYYFIPIVCTFFALIFSFFAYKGFKNHQMG